MTKIVAFIVGIDEYDFPTWTIRGPSKNAVSIAEALVRFAAPKDIHLFVLPHPEDALSIKARTDELGRLGVIVRATGKWNDIYTFWSRELPTNRAPNSVLLVYWSGHGYTLANKRRIFICSDLTEETLRLHLDVSDFQTALLTNSFDSFPDQFLLADVCASYSPGLIFPSIDSNHQGLNERKQISYFASREGVTTQTDEFIGMFTNVLLKLIAELQNWPTPQDFSNLLKEKISELKSLSPKQLSSLEPFRVSYWDSEESATIAPFEKFKSTRYLVTAASLLLLFFAIIFLIAKFGHESQQQGLALTPPPAAPVATPSDPTYLSFAHVSFPFFLKANNIDAIYNGEFKHKQCDGDGKLTVKEISGDSETYILSYEGHFTAGRFHGSGKLLGALMYPRQAGRSFLEGEFKFGTFMEGHGHIFHETGDIPHGDHRSLHLMEIDYDGKVQGIHQDYQQYYDDVAALVKPLGRGTLKGFTQSRGYAYTIVGDWDGYVLGGDCTISIEDMTDPEEYVPGIFIASSKRLKPMETGRFQNGTLIAGQVEELPNEAALGVDIPGGDVAYTGDVKNGKMDGSGKLLLRKSKNPDLRDYGKTGTWKDGKFYDGVEIERILLGDGLTARTYRRLYENGKPGEGVPIN